MSGCVYLVTHIESGKAYVGQFCMPNPAARWKRHVREALTGSPFYFHRAINKYGPEAFTYKVIRTCPLDHLGALESYYAEIYNSYVWGSGFNTAMCGPQFALGIPKSPEHKAKIKEGVHRNWLTRRAKISSQTSRVSDADPPDVRASDEPHTNLDTPQPSQPFQPLASLSHGTHSGPPLRIAAS